MTIGDTRRRTVGETEWFINPLRAACGGRKMNASLRNLLSLLDDAVAE